MKITRRWIAQITTLCLGLVLAGAPGLGAAWVGQQNLQETQEPSAQPSADQPAAPSQDTNRATTESDPSQRQSERLPDSPGTVRSSQSASAVQTPVGTAAAEVSGASGVAASKPAGVAIAPAKQRRVRSFLIKIGAIVGAGVAVGTVMVLSAGSPSRPPGAR